MGILFSPPRYLRGDGGVYQSDEGDDAVAAAATSAATDTNSLLFSVAVVWGQNKDAMNTTGTTSTNCNRRRMRKIRHGEARHGLIKP